MKAKYISYQDTHSFSKLVLDYVNDETALKPFYNFRPDINGFKEAIAKRKFNADRKVLADVLTQQYKQLNPHEAVSNNIKLLTDEQTFTITTGHQLNLFTGPLYFIYKIVTAINLARQLKSAFPDKNFVPVYWMATEDHDFEEINHITVDEKHISWIGQSNGATGRLSTKSVAAAVMAYKGYLGISENGKKLAKLVEKAYLEHDNLADATRSLVNSLFEKHGLVIINADEPALKREFAPIMLRDIMEQQSAAHVDKTSLELTENGYKTQVNGREINFFYLKENLRERLLYKDGEYIVNHSDIRFSKETLVQEMEAHPERFSPNVIMRPLYQEVILPNIAYIGGGAEVAYWMQLKGNFDFYNVDFPILLLRNSALILDERSVHNLHQLGFSIEDIFLPAATLQKMWVEKHSELRLNLNDEIRAVQAIFDQIKLNAFKVDKTLEASSDAAKTKTIHLLGNLEKKLYRAEKKKHEISLKQIENLKARLFPNGVLQERVLNIAPMYVNYGNDFIDSLIAHFEALGGDFTVLLA